MHLAELHLTDFRNFAEVSLQFPPAGAAICGANGSGKTNLLEAIHVLCTGRSHRDALRAQMIRFESPACRIGGVFENQAASERRRASAGFGRDRSVSMALDGQPVASLSAWLGCAAALSFGPEDLRLVWGAPRERRRFLDMLICQIDVGYLSSLMRYRNALISRNRMLAGKIDNAQLDVYDAIMADSGSAVAARRRCITAFLADSLAQMYREMSGAREAGSMHFRPSVEADAAAESEWKNVFLKRVKDARSIDIQRGFSTIGPHRDDLLFCINGKPAREFGSRGQCRSLALAARLASVLCAEHFIRRKLIFLIDDAFSELDHERIQRIVPLLENRGQMFVAAPVPTPLGNALARLQVADNRVTAV